MLPNLRFIAASVVASLAIMTFGFGLFAAFRIANRMVLLDRGKFVAEGTPEQMKSSDNPLVHQFIFGLTEGPLTERRKADGYESDLLG